jgi:hypothetical protein
MVPAEKNGRKNKRDYLTWKLKLSQIEIYAFHLLHLVEKNVGQLI